MTTRQHFIALLSLGLFAAGCSTNESNTFTPPKKSGLEECSEYTAWTALSSTACTDCLHANCAAPFQVYATVCPSNIDHVCQADAGSQGFCACMVNASNGCGDTAANVFACFVNECGTSCGKAAVDAGHDVQIDAPKDTGTDVVIHDALNFGG